MKTLAFLSLFISFSTFAQNKIYDDVLFLRDHLSLNSSFTFFNGGLYPVSPTSHLILENSYGANISFKYLINIEEEWAIESGIILGTTSFDVSLDDQSFETPYIRSFLPYTELPFLLTHRLKVADRSFLTVQMGYSFVRFSTGSNFTYMNNGRVTMHINQTAPAFPFGSLKFSIGFMIRKNNSDMIRISLNQNFFLNQVYSANIKYFNGDKMTHSYSTNFFKPNFTALEVGYIFTRTKKTNELLK